MTSRNGRPELISLLQYMRHTTLNSEDVIVKDKRIEKGAAQTLIKNIDSAMKNLGIDFQQTCEILGTSVTEYENARKVNHQ